MGRSGVADTTSLLNFGEEHLTFVRRWASSCLKPSRSQTAFLTLPLRGKTLEEGKPAGGAVSSRPVNADGSPQRISYEVFDFDNLAGFDWDEGNKQKN